MSTNVIYERARVIEPLALKYFSNPDEIDIIDHIAWLIEREPKLNDAQIAYMAATDIQCDGCQ